MQRYRCLISILLSGLFSATAVFAQEGFQPYEVYISGKNTPAVTSGQEEQNLASDEKEPAQSDGPWAEVLFISGEVEVKMADEASYIEAEEGLYLQAGDEIKTASNSYVELGFDEDEANIVRLDADTYATLILQNGEQLNLLRGKAFATIDSIPAGSSFEIRTPTAVVGVRGTDWLTTVEEDITDIEVYDGSPYLKSMKEDGTFREEETIVSAGYKVRIERFQPPMKPQKLSSQRLKQWKDKRTDIRKHAFESRSRRRQIPGFERRIKIKERLRKLLPNQPASAAMPKNPAGGQIKNQSSPQEQRKPLLGKPLPRIRFPSRR